MIDMRWIELSEPSGNYLRFGGKPCKLQYRVRMGNSIGWWIDVKLEAPVDGERIQPADFDPLNELPAEEQAKAKAFFNELEGKNG